MPVGLLYEGVIYTNLILPLYFFSVEFILSKSKLFLFKSIGKIFKLNDLNIFNDTLCVGFSHKI